MWAGVDSAWEQKKLEARKMLVNRAESHTSGAPVKMGVVILYKRNRGAMAIVYSEAASTQAEQSSGECLVQLPRCTVVSDQNDVSTGGARKLTTKRTDPVYAERLYTLK